ncbi:unnamed protein product [Effrenium voratum]|nr:unnamed protein product [Effrenium voratum]
MKQLSRSVARRWIRAPHSFSAGSHCVRPLCAALRHRHWESWSFPVRFPSRAYQIRTFAVQGQSYYEVLGVAQSASQAEIKKAYLAAARKCHPDLNPSKDATVEFQRLAEAYQVLSDETRRATYDRYLRTGESGQTPSGGYQEPPDLDPSDIFRHVYEELRVEQILQRLRGVQQEASKAAVAAQGGDFSLGKAFVWKHKGLAAAVLLPLGLMLRFPQVVGMALRVLGVVAGTLLQSRVMRELIREWVWVQWRLFVQRAHHRRGGRGKR